MGTYESTGKLELQTPAVEFIQHLTRKTYHVSVYFAAVDLRFIVEPNGSETRTVTVNIVGNLVWGAFNRVKATFTVGEDMTTNCLTYIFRFEKISNSIDPRDMVEFLRCKLVGFKIVESLFTHILLSDVSYNRKIKHNSIDAEYPVDECFKGFVNAFEADDKVERIGFVDWQKRTFTFSFTNAPSMMRNFKTIKVTITVISKNEGSRVKWTIEVEKINENTEEPASFFFIAWCIRGIILSKFHI